MWDEPLAERAERAVALLQRLPEQKRVLVLADADVDGVAGAAALATAFQRTNRRFVARLTRRRDPEFWNELLEHPPDFLVTADLGATEVARFEAARVPTIVLDHHVPARAGDDDGPVVHVNPHLVHEDGSATASGAAVATVFSMVWLEAHGRRGDDLLAYALVGARGDRYHGSTDQPGLHSRVEAAIGATNPDPARRVPGTGLGVGPVGDAIAAGLDPFVARAAGKPGAAAGLLRDAGIDPEAVIESLAEEERRTLTSWLALELMEQGADAGFVRDATRPGWVCGDGAPLMMRGKRIDDIVARLDAAARQGEAAKGLAALLGHANSWEAIDRALADWQAMVRGPLSAAARGRLQPLGPGHLGRIEVGPYAGCVADRIMAWTKMGATPVVVIGPMGSRVKASLRARHGGPKWDLDRVASEAAAKVGGVGGGHHLAAGATIPADQEDAFLTAVAEALRKVATRKSDRPEVTH